LCGECKSGLSLVFGSSKCLQCTQPSPIDAPFFCSGWDCFSPPAAHLQTHSCSWNHQWADLLCKYFQSQLCNLLPTQPSNILTVFISWVNLDLSIEVCFFDGMDEALWLQVAVLATFLSSLLWKAPAYSHHCNVFHPLDYSNAGRLLCGYVMESFNTFTVNIVSFLLLC